MMRWVNPFKYLTGAPQIEGGEASAALLAPGLALHRMNAGTGAGAEGVAAHNTEHRHAHA